jgi:hypothetical protein
MVDQNDGSSPEPRPPTLNDLLHLCGELNRAGARYIVVGGMAMIQHGFTRATEDIDLLVDPSPENFEKIRAALMTLPDQAIREVKTGELDQYMVIRVGDEIVVDLMKAACGIEYAEASQDITTLVIQSVTIPFASPQLLWRMKQTHRDKDSLDRLFLAELLKNENR